MTVSRLPAIAFVALLSFATSGVFAQGTRSDYERADNLGSLTSNKVFKTKIEPHWLPDNTRFWYRNDLPDGARQFVLVGAAKGKRRLAFNHKRMAAALSQATKSECKATQLPIDDISPAEKERAVFVKARGGVWKCNLRTYAIEKAEWPKPAAGPNRAENEQPRGRHDHRRSGSTSESPRKAESPDGKWVAFIRDFNVHVREKETGEEFALSTEGTEEDAFRDSCYWSPDSKRLVVLRTKKGGERLVYFIESSPKDQVQPKLHSHKYLKPGDAIAMTKPHLFDVAAKKPIPVADDLFPTPWSLGRIRWDADGRRFTFEYNQRGHQVMRVIAVDAESGKATAIINEEPGTFVDYHGKHFIQYFDATNEIVWMSERDGWNHLYLICSQSGKVKSQITKGEWVVRNVVRVDAQKRQIWFRAGGVYPSQDPYYIHYGRVHFDGTGLVWLTEGDGTHSVSYSPDQRFLIDTYSRVDMPPVHELRRTCDGSLVCKLEKASMSLLKKTGWKVPEPFVAEGRDGKTDICGVIFRPTNFNPRKKYPVIEQIYAGPHGAFVPKGFRSHHGAQTMAELGFILVQIDGMGTSHRSKAFHDVCHKNLGDSGFPDRILWMKAAAAKYPYMDVTRVGIYGGSAGGQSATRAMFAHGDFYKVAVSDCGCHDNRMDKIWWNELWMSWPIGPHYEEQSNVTQAHNLTGKLFLIVGEMDKNVDPASTMQVVDALIKADKDFDLLVVPGAGHGLGGKYGVRRRRDYFVRHLLGVQPRREP